MDTTSKPLAPCAGIYTRISDDATGEGLGVARQLEDNRTLAQSRGWTIGAEHCDNDISAAGTKTRPGFDALLADADAGRIQVIVAWSLDRLTRNARDRLRLLEVGRRRGLLVALARGSDMDLSTPAGRLTADILASVAQAEIEIKSDRQKRAVQQAAKAGRRVGGRRPFGYDADGMTVREREAQAVREGYAALLSGVPLARIARDWNAAKLTTGHGGQWAAGTVRGTLINPRYAGLRAHAPVPEHGRRRYWEPPDGGTWPRAQWPAVVGEETWRAAVELLSDPTRRTAPRSGKGLLTGLALCGVCGEADGATVHGGRTRAGDKTYRCSAALGHVSRAQAPVDEWIGAVMVARLSRPDAAELLVDAEAPDLPALRGEAMALRTRLEQLAELLADGTLTAGQVREAAGRLRSALAEVETKMTSAGRVDVLGPLVAAQDVEAAWAGLDIDRQRAVIGHLATVTLLPPGRGTRTFRPETVRVEWHRAVE